VSGSQTTTAVGREHVAAGEPLAGELLSADPIVPSEILAAWRAAERRYARAIPGTDDAAAEHLEMRRLMDAYEWRVRGGIPADVRR
jgi:hypothetical protein